MMNHESGGLVENSLTLRGEIFTSGESTAVCGSRTGGGGVRLVSGRSVGGSGELGDFRCFRGPPTGGVVDGATKK